jgi:hypothetical protein
VKLDHLEKLSFPPGFLTQRSLSGLAARVNEVLSRARVDSEKEEKLSYWQLVFLQSKVKAARTAARRCRMRSGNGPGIRGFKNSWNIISKVSN